MQEPLGRLVHVSLTWWQTEADCHAMVVAGHAQLLEGLHTRGSVERPEGPGVPEVLLPDQAMGDKTRARALAEEVGVPTVPGSPGEVHGAAEALELARRIGLPVMLKAAHGGGGRGMRVVRQGTVMKPC